MGHVANQRPHRMDTGEATANNEPRDLGMIWYINHISQHVKEVTTNMLANAWERLNITFDSGAVDTVGPKTVAPHIKIEPNEASRKGMTYRAANNTKIGIYGQKRIKGITADGTTLGIDVNIAEVKKTLGSVRRICERGNRVVFDDEGSYIEHKETGKITPIVKRSGAYVLEMWTEKPTQVFSGPAQWEP